MSDPSTPSRSVRDLLSSTVDLRDLDVARIATPETEPGLGLPLIDRFEPCSELGRGGMGRVLEAHDPELGRAVAIKVVLDPDAVSSERLMRFVQEARVTSQLEHPNIVPVHDMGVTMDGRVFYVMKKVEGTSLRQLIRRLRADVGDARERWTRTRLLNVFVQVCQAIAYAHSRGVLHRDLKPDNVMLGAFGEVLVMDWGLARVSDAPSEDTARMAVHEEGTGWETRDGIALGTPGYMSPEQARGYVHRVDERSDLWALGAILYELLTFQRAIGGEDTGQRLKRTVAGPPDDPREAWPERRVPDEVARICLRALALEPDERHAGVDELKADVVAFLEGSRRKEAARERLAEAERLWTERAEQSDVERRLGAELKALEAQVEPWAPLDDPTKSKLLATRERLDALVGQQATRFARAVAAAERALSQDPDSVEARGFLARAYWTRFEAAERAGDPGEIAFFLDRVREYDTGRYAELLEGSGALTLVTDPPGARVLAARYDQSGLVWELDKPRFLGVTPLRDRTLPMGSWLLTIQLEGRRDTLLPVKVGRGSRCGDERPVPLLTEEQIGGPDWVYVPPGWTIVGADPPAGKEWPLEQRYVEGFLMARYPVTAGQYAEFLNDLAERGDPSLAERMPRMPGAPGKPSTTYWKIPSPGAPLRFPLDDVHGDPWSGDWPACGITWGDSAAYAAWRADVEGRSIRLLSEVEYERAARGADGRSFPWGDRFDPSLCKMGSSREGRPQPEPVGTFDNDRSSFGVCDLAGGIRAWCRETDYEGDERRRAIRGGAWSSTERACRATNRFGLEVEVTHAYLGARLAVSVEL
jgi:eukaryotic-like serine/threonine-protein kinase